MAVYSWIVQLFLIRHAEAVEETVTLRDPSRHLTPRGRIQARELGDRMRWHDCLPSHIWASPLVRAVQTAELVAAGLHADTTIEIVPALAPDGSPRDVVAAVGALGEHCAVMVVGHEPSLSAIGALAINAPEFEVLGKAQAARIVDGALRWRFAWDADAPDPAPAR
jgi:phosphohistidine phosphatase